MMEHIVGKVMAALVIAIATPMVLLIQWWDERGYE